MHRKCVLLFLLIVAYADCKAQNDNKWLKDRFDTLKVEGTYRIDTLYDCFAVMKIYKDKQKYTYEIIASEYYQTGKLYAIKDDKFFGFKLEFDNLSQGNMYFDIYKKGWTIRFDNHAKNLGDGRIIKECNGNGYNFLDFLKIN